MEQLVRKFPHSPYQVLAEHAPEPYSILEGPRMRAEGSSWFWGRGFSDLGLVVKGFGKGVFGFAALCPWVLTCT